MKISEVAAKTGMDVSTIRFYERKDLIKPSRSEDNLYRNYTEQDLLRLKQIMLCRKVNMSIEDIRKVVSGEDTFTEILMAQLGVLEAEQAQISNALELCKKMIADEADGKTDVDEYLSYVAAAEKKGKYFPDLLPLLLDEIAEATDLPRMVGYPLADKILRHTALRRMMSLAVIALLVVFPAWMIIEHTVFWIQGEYSAVRLVGLIIVAGLMIGAFVEMIKENK